MKNDKYFHFYLESECKFEYTTITNVNFVDVFNIHKYLRFKDGAIKNLNLLLRSLNDITDVEFDYCKSIDNNFKIENKEFNSKIFHYLISKKFNLFE